MVLENKILSKEIQQYLYDNGKTLGTAESCTGGRIAEAIIASPGASNYFKGGIISYTNETGIAGPGGGTAAIPVGTIWIGYGSKEDVRTYLLTGDEGRDVNLAVATNKALKLFLMYLKELNIEEVSAEN